jgi:hypothetical protein
MKVKMLINVAASYGCTLKEREEGEVPDKLGSLLVENKWAICLDEPILAVPPNPAIAEAAPTKATKKATGKPAGKPQIKKDESDG